MALQTASDLFRVRSSFDSGDLYEVFFKSVSYVPLNATYSVGFLCSVREDLVHKFFYPYLSFHIMACANSKHDSCFFTFLASHALKLAIRGDNM